MFVMNDGIRQYQKRASFTACLTKVVNNFNLTSILPSQTIYFK